MLQMRTIMTHTSLVAALGQKAKQLVTLDVAWGNRAPPLETHRPTRRAMRTEEMDADLFEALQSADYSHIDPELNKLLS